MAKCINDIVNPDIKASPTKSATSSTVSNKKDNGDKKLEESFLDSISSATKRLRNTDCSKEIGDFFSSSLPKTTNVAGQVYDFVANDLNLQSGMKAFGGLVDKLELNGEGIATSFCVTVGSLADALIFYLEIALKAAPLLFKKLDKLRAKLEKVLTEFNSAVRDCIVGVIIDTKLAVNKVVNKVLDLDILVELADNCPCVIEILQGLFDCREDDNGNKLTTGEEVVSCIQDKYNIDPTQIVNTINDLVDNSIIGNIDKGFNVIDELIKSTIELLFTPIRELFKVYCDLLTHKNNVTFLVEGLGDAKCLLIYTDEKDEFTGLPYKGMSILDILNTLKLWVNCFETVCDGLVDDYRLKLKEANEDLRIDSKFWRDIVYIDLYQSCIAQKVQRSQDRPTMIRELFIKNKNKGKDPFNNLIDVFKQVGKISYETSTTDRTIGQVAEALKFANGPEAEDVPLEQGVDEFESGVEEKVKDIIRNIKNSLDRDPYYELFLQLLEWQANFIKSESHVKLIYDTIEQNQRISKVIPDSTSISTAKDTGASERRSFGNPNVIDAIFYPTYQLNNDYEQDEIDMIGGYSMPKQNENEPKDLYYNRVYQEIFS